MVVINLNRYYEIDPYFKELSAADLRQNRDWVYRILPTPTDAEGCRVGFEFLDDRYTSFYGLKWA